jgi:hypothetical protein
MLPGGLSIRHRRHMNERVAGEAPADGVLALSNHSRGIDNVLCNVLRLIFSSVGRHA